MFVIAQIGRFRAMPILYQPGQETNATKIQSTSHGDANRIHLLTNHRHVLFLPSFLNEFEHRRLSSLPSLFPEIFFDFLICIRRRCTFIAAIAATVTTTATIAANVTAATATVATTATVDQR